jgi:hypothetical protein
VSDLVIVDGDTLTVNFGAALVTPNQGSLSGSSNDFFVKNSPVCRRGDEIPPSLRGSLSYTEGAYSIPGQGTLAVSPQTTTVLKNGGMALLLRGTQFQATFTVTKPATTPLPVSSPDTVLSKTGTASFTTSNTVLKAS